MITQWFSQAAPPPLSGIDIVQHGAEWRGRVPGFRSSAATFKCRIEFYATFERGITFFDILRELVSEYQRSYNPPKTIKARLQNEPERNWTIFYDPKTRAFGFTNGPTPTGNIEQLREPIGARNLPDAL